jgi:hypothetical protein
MSEQQNKANPPGCSTSLLVLGIGAIAGGVCLMGRWEALPAVGKTGAVVLVVLGTVWVLPFLLLLALRIFIKRTVGKLGKDFAEAGRRIVQDGKAMYGEIHEYRAATEADFAGLDREFYESTGSELASLGFRYLGDLVNESIAALKGVTPVIRVMTSADGTTVAAFYHLNSARRPDRKLLTCEFETEFSDGTFLTSGNTQESNPLTPPPRIHARRYPRATPVSQLVQLHEAERQKLMAADAGLTCTSVNTVPELVEFQKRQQQIKNDFRKGIGFIEPDEVRRVGQSSNGNPDVTESVAQAVEEARRREQQDNRN